MKNLKLFLLLFVISAQAQQGGMWIPSLLQGMNEKENQDLSVYDVFIADTIGILTKIYSYGDIAYVGGGFGTSGLHNILEPATFGIPVVIGPNYQKFSEAVALVNMGGCISVKDKKALEETLSHLIQNEDERLEKGHICATFVEMNKNATAIIMAHISDDNV